MPHLLVRTWGTVMFRVRDEFPVGSPVALFGTLCRYQYTHPVPKLTVPLPGVASRGVAPWKAWKPG